MGHAFERCSLKLKSNESQLAKKMHFSGLLFLSIVEAGGSAFTAVRIGSYLIKILRKNKLVYVIFILKFTYII